MRRAALNIILLIIAVALLGACHRESRVEWLEPLTDDYPDSALTILRQLSQEKLSARDRAICNLLLTRAIDKASTDYQTDDSLARAALDYFSHHDDPHFEMLSHYYLGQIAFTNKDYTEAILSLQQCVDLADQLGDHLNLALAYRTLSDLYRETYFGPDAIQAAKLALSEFEKSGDKGTKYLKWAHDDIANAYLAGGEYDSCVMAVDKMLAEFDLTDDIYLERSIICIKALAYNKKNRSDSALLLVPRMLELGAPNQLTYEELHTLAYIYSTNGHLDQSRYFIDLLHEQGYIYNMEYINLYYEGKYKDAFEDLMKTMKQYNMSFTGIEKSPVSHAEKVYLQYKSEKKEYRHLIETYKLYILFLIFFVVSVIFSSILYIRKKKIKLTLLQKTAEITDLLNDMVLKDRRISDMLVDRDTLQANHKELTVAYNNLLTEKLETRKESKDELLGLTHEQLNYRILLIRESIFKELRSFDKIFQEFIVQKKKDELSSNLLKSIENTLSQLMFKTGTISKLEHSVNSQIGNVMVLFRNDFPHFDKLFYAVFLYAILRFKPGTIAIFTDSTPQRIYEIKRTLKKNIEKTSSQYCEIYNYLLHQY